MHSSTIPAPPLRGAVPSNSLVLTRYPDETIIVGGNIRITILEVRGSKVRVLVQAPREITVHRLEVQERIDQQDRNIFDGMAGKDGE